jgi:RNA 3'-terminal phosphate cyclase
MDPLLTPIIAVLVKAVAVTVAGTQAVAQNGAINELRGEAERQELTMHMAERQAKVAQELALANRIDTAEEVEMEEFYDLSGSGQAGVSADGEGFKGGIGGKGQKVTKRIFRFKGGAVKEH